MAKRRNTSIAERFGRNLLRARQDAGLSQEALAALCSLHRTEIGYLEGGKRVPRLDTLVKLATALEVPLDDFTQGIEWVRGETSAGGFLVRPQNPAIPTKSNQQTTQRSQQQDPNLKSQQALQEKGRTRGT